MKNFDIFFISMKSFHSNAGIRHNTDKHKSTTCCVKRFPQITINAIFRAERNTVLRICTLLK